MTSQPFVSVIIPSYHRNDLLAKCLQCLAPGVQTFPAEQYEVIVTDDGSSTTAEEMIRLDYPWAKWLAGPRKGPAANRNNGAKYARGEWLVFTDDDCLPDKNWLQAFAKAIELNIHVYEGKTTCEAGIRSPLEHAPINLTGGYLWSCNMMVRNKLFHQLGRFNENYPYPHLEDIDFKERIKQADYTFLFIENAKVDHPPRKALFGRNLAALHESDIYYWHQVKKIKLNSLNFLTYILKSRLKQILRYPPSSHSLLAILSTIIELIYTVINLNTWYKKYPCV